MLKYELERYKEIVLLAKYFQKKDDFGGFSYEERRKQAMDYLDADTNAKFDIYKNTDENGVIIDGPKVYQLTLFK